MHIVVAGAGRMGAHHAHVFASLADVSALTIVDVDAGRAQAICDELRVVDRGTAAPLTLTAADDVSAVLGASGAGVVDGLVIAAATPAHADLIVAGAAARVPTLCEKPVALGRADTERALAAVAAAGTYLQVGFQRRFDEGFVAARDAIASGALGDLHLIRLGTLDPAPPPVEYLRASGGVFRDMHIHDFDSVRFVTGDEVATVTAVGAVTVDPAIGDLGDVDTTAVVLTMRSGALVVMSGCRQNPRGYDVRLEAIGSRDAITVGLGPRTPLRSADAHGLFAGARDGDGANDGAHDGPHESPHESMHGGNSGAGNGWEFFIDRFRDAYRAQAEAFLAVIATGAHGGGPAAAANRCTGDDGRAALLLAVAAERSRASGAAVRVEDIAAEVVS